MKIDILVIPYDKKLAEKFIYNGTEKEFSGTEIIPILEFYSKMGASFMGLIDEKIIGIGGVYKLWENAGGCFLFLNKEAQNYKKSVFKILLKYMNALIKQYQIKTLIAECQDNNLEAQRLIEHLGFKKNRETKTATYTKG